MPGEGIRISTLAPTRGATAELSEWKNPYGFQLSPLHEGRRKQCNFINLITNISTLAPTRGATVDSLKVLPFSLDFNSRPYTRGDSSWHWSRVPIMDFNSRPYTRGDTRCQIIWLRFRISTLAPTRGATILEESDIEEEKFQLSPLHEGRQNFQAALTLTGDFNSRPYTRGDWKRMANLVRLIIFQLSPLHEGRPINLYALEAQKRFQLSPLHEGRLGGNKK